MDVDRRVLKLAVPALGVLVAEPLFLLGDAVVVSHLGTDEVSGLGAAGALLATLVQVCVFLTYGTTASIARQMASGDVRGATASAANGIALAVALGVVLALLGWFSAPWLIDAINVAGPARPYALDYLRVSVTGIPFMLVVLAATGVLRGLMDMRAPLYIVVAGAAVNLLLNYLLVFPAGLGIEGSALGTVLTQGAMAALFLGLLRGRARALGAPLRASWAGIRRSSGANFALFLRTVALRAALLVAVGVAGGLGVAALAAYTIAVAIWNLLALALDALAIAAQVLIADARGAGDRDRLLQTARRIVRLGVYCGCVAGVAVALLAAPLIPLLTPDPEVRRLLWGAIFVIALLQPVAGAVFALDGILIGAEDATFLAWAALGCTAVFVAAVIPVAVVPLDLTALWIAIGVMTLARLLVLSARLHWFGTHGGPATGGRAGP